MLAEVVAFNAPDQIVVKTQSFDQCLRQPSITREIFSTWLYRVCDVAQNGTPGTIEERSYMQAALDKYNTLC